MGVCVCLCPCLLLKCLLPQRSLGTMFYFAIISIFVIVQCALQGHTGRKWEMEMCRETKLKKRSIWFDREITEWPPVKKRFLCHQQHQEYDERKWNDWKYGNSMSTDKDLNRTSALNQIQMSVLALPSRLMSQWWCSQHLSSSSFLFPLFLFPSFRSICDSQTVVDDSAW